MYAHNVSKQWKRNPSYLFIRFDSFECFGEDGGRAVTGEELSPYHVHQKCQDSKPANNYKQVGEVLSCLDNCMFVTAYMSHEDQIEKLIINK